MQREIKYFLKMKSEYMMYYLNDVKGKEQKEEINLLQVQMQCSKYSIDDNDSHKC